MPRPGAPTSGASEPFNESLVASEDFEWSDRVRARGFAIVFDPAFTVPGHHRTAQGPGGALSPQLPRVSRHGSVPALEPPTLRRSLSEWWYEHPPDTKPHRQWLSPYRIAVIGGRYMAGRSLQAAGAR